MLRNTILDLMNDHQSIRAFTDQPVSQEQIDTILTAALAGPNIQNFQPVTFIEITDQALKAEITQVVGMKYIETATRFFVVAVDYSKDLIGLDAEQQALVIEKLKSYQFFEGGVISASIALGRAQIAAESLGLGTVTMAGAMGAYELYEERLKLPAYVKPIMGFSLGYADQNPGVKPKLPLAGSLMKDYYRPAQMAQAVADYNETMRQYFAKRGIDSDWTQHNIKLFGKLTTNPGLSAYPQAKGFDLN